MKLRKVSYNGKEYFALKSGKTQYALMMGSEDHSVSVAYVPATRVEEIKGAPAAVAQDAPTGENKTAKKVKKTTKKA